MDDTEIRVELARLDERLKALSQDHARSEAASASALGIASNELARRLDDLNHAHQLSIEKDAMYVPRETLDANLRRIEDRIGPVETAVHEFKARSSQSWLLWGVLVALVGLGVAVANLAFK